MTIHMKELMELMRVLLAIFRYPAAVVVSFVASMATVCYLPELSQPWTSNNNSVPWDLILFFLTGLTGVAAGSFCLPRNQRWVGSLCLLFLGLGFAFYVFRILSEDDSGTFDFFSLVALGVGGVVPAIIYYLRRSKSESKLTEKETLILVISAIFLVVIVTVYVLFFSWTPLWMDDPG